MTRILLLGGFLGSGKTTFMIESAKILEKKGYRTAVITNDQGDTLVDTMYSRMKGVSAREVSGGCFCCRFPDFLSSVKDIAAREKPDFIIAEAVGSCTDLAATVINPLKAFHRDLVEVAGFLTLVDSERILGDFLHMDLDNPVAPSEVLISHQIKEARTLILSKTDLLNSHELDEAEACLAHLNPDAEVFRCSSRTGEGLGGLMEKAEQGFSQDFSERVPIDYDVYAQAEAEYGWFNGSWFLKGRNPFSPEEISFRLMDSFSNPLLGYVAHAKLFLLAPDGSLKVSYVGGRIQADQIALSGIPANSIQVILNIRAASSPEVIENHVESLHRTLETEGFSIEEYQWNSLIPSPPEPYYS